MFASKLLFVLLFCLLAGCQARPEPARALVEPQAKSDTFKVVTYNTLHGLEVSQLWVRQVESDAERLGRFTARIDQLAEIQPDVVLLQEVNPLPNMAQQYVARSKRADWNMLRSIKSTRAVYASPQALPWYRG